ncbi:MAG: metallophosphoesterase family protein [Xanthobacteraceae bacterium]|nr:metallophosphoesterase family protein [Xanthobacteraceae bacterium]
MRLWILSDMHVERGIEDIAAAAPEFDVFVCCGDVFTADIDMAIEMVASIAQGKPAVFVAGNHEWAGGVLEVVAYKGQVAAEKHGVYWLELDTVEIGGIRFAGATLWTPNDARFAPSVGALARAEADVIVTHFPPPPVIILPTLREGGLWIYGHHHGHSDRTIAGRRLVRNAGYEGEAVDGEPVRPDYVVEIAP